MTIYPARVQGEGAPAEIAAAVSAFSRVPGSADVLIVARGGGSKEDLAAFNDERVVRAVAASAVPTLSAVGHEVDVTLTDLAADVRAATPSQAAELVVERREDFERRLGATGSDLRKILRGKLAEADGELKGMLLSTGFAAFPSKDERRGGGSRLRGGGASLDVPGAAARVRRAAGAAGREASRLAGAGGVPPSSEKLRSGHGSAGGSDEGGPDPLLGPPRDALCFPRRPEPSRGPLAGLLGDVPRRGDGAADRRVARRHRRRAQGPASSRRTPGARNGNEGGPMTKS